MNFLLGGGCMLAVSDDAGPPIRWNDGLPSKLVTLLSMLRDDKKDLFVDTDGVQLEFSNLRFMALWLLRNMSG